MAALTNFVDERLGFGTLPTAPAGVVVQIAEAGVSVDSPEKTITRAAGTGLTLSSGVQFDVTQALAEALGFSTEQSKDYTDLVPETLTFALSHTRIASLERAAATSLGITPAYAKTITVTVAEDITIRTRVVRGPNAHFHDIAVRNRGMGADEIALNARGHAPADYRPFTAFLPGDFTFQEARVAIRLAAPLNVDTPAIYETVMNFDLPDVIEKGRVTTVVTTSPANNGWTAVSLTKTFNQVPDVVTTPLSGTVPVIVETQNITKTSFQLRTLDAATRAPVGATQVSWTAIGI